MLEGSFRIGNVDEIMNEQVLSGMYGIPVEVDRFDGHRIVVARRLVTGSERATGSGRSGSHRHV